MATGIVYDEQMCLHESDGHPEQPDRIRYIYKAIQEEKLLDKCIIIDARKATDNEILLVHDKFHLDQMKITSTTDNLTLAKYCLCQLNSVYLNQHSYLCALLSVGSVVELCEQVITGKLLNGIAIVRPPGHHAESNTAMGFCIFNNVAIAARVAMLKHKVKRVVIIDWDAHHGNATQHTFEHNPNLLYISIHRYDNGTFYPCSLDADPRCIGIGPGVGRNVNIAWNTNNYSTIGDSEYIYAYNNLIQPMLEEYEPELIIVSAGFDCARNDPLGGLDVTPAGFNYLTSELTKFANGRIVIALEGGYNLDSISKSMTACLKALLKEQFTSTDNYINNNVSQVAINAVNATMKAHLSYWKFLAQSID